MPLWGRSVLAAGDYPTPVPREELEDAQRVGLPPSPIAREVGDRPLDAHGGAEDTSLALARIRTHMRDDVMPEPDGKMGQSAWWWSSTIRRWQATRRGIGKPQKKRAE